MDPTQAQTPQRAEAERSLAIAIKLLSARDLVGSKRFADLALDADPTLSDDRADQILAVADVLLASNRRINNHLPNWYSILQLPPTSVNSPPHDFSTLLKSHHRRLSLLLHPDRNRLPGADSAFRLVSDALAVLSDPSKKSIYDSEYRVSENIHQESPSGTVHQPSSFWTLCNSCCHAHQYARNYLNKTLRCQNCRKPFHAVELPTVPTVVPGTDMYYATWGFFPIGFANPNSADWTPFVAVTPGGGGGLHHQNEHGSGGPSTGGGGGGYKKKVARKKVLGRPRKRVAENQGNGAEGREQGEEARGININEAAKGVGEEDIDMIIDLASTDEMLGNLQNLPFLKDGAINIRFQ